MLQLKIVSPEKVVFNGEVTSITVPGSMGNFEILIDHAPIISSLERGVVKYTASGGAVSEFAILGGFVEVQKNVVSLCVEIKED